MKFITLLFLLISALHIFLAFHLPAFIPPQEFPYKDLIYKYFHIYPFSPFANFDGYQYISIAKNGYNELQQSYFPLYPALLAVLAHGFHVHFLLSGILISWVCFFLGLVFFYKLSGLLLKQEAEAKWAVILLAVFPAAFYYQVIYTESLFLFVSAAALYFLFSKKYLWAALFAVAASLTKIQGVLLIIPFLLVIIGFTSFSPKSVWAQLRKQGKVLPYALAPLYGLLLYSGYLYLQHGDPLYYYHAQSAFGAERSVDKLILLPQVLFRYLKIFLTTPMNFSFWIAMLEFWVCLSVAGVITYELFRLFRQKKKDLHHISLQTYSLAVLLLPTLTGTLTSLPRYVLISFGFFIVLAKIRLVSVKVIAAILFLLLQIILFVYFLKGYFIS